jgi:hypothetical protein
MGKNINLKTAPIWLPLLFLARDFIAFQYIFSFEPGITQHAVTVGYTFMLPGSLIGGGMTTISANLAIGLCIGFLLRFVAQRRAKRA